MPDIAQSISARDFRECWLDSLKKVFATRAHSGGYSVAQFTDQVFQPGYTFSMLPGRSSPFPEPDDYERLCAFARAVGDDRFLAQYVAYGWWRDGDPDDSDEVIAGLFSASATWDEMRTATVGYPAGPLAESERALSYNVGFSDFYIWSPQARWGIFHSSDAELAIAGTWGPAATLALRQAFSVEGDGWTPELLGWWADAPSGAPSKSPLVTDLYVRRPLVPAPRAAVTPDLPAEEQAVLTALYALALASAQPGAAVSAAGAAQVRWALAEALGRQYRPAVTVALGAEASQAGAAVRAAASAVLAAAHRLGTDEAPGG